MNEEIIKLNSVAEAMKNHRHNGVNDQKINLSDVVGLIRTTSTVPTHTPKNLFEQFVIYTSGVTYRFYWYDSTNNVWHYVTATA